MDVKSGVLTGAMFAGDTAEGNDAYTGDNLERLREGIVFESDDHQILFRSAIGQYVQLKESDFSKEDVGTVYYPYHNETVVEVENPQVNTTEMEKIRDEVCLRYIIADSTTYIQSQIEETSYMPNHIVVNGMVYAVTSFSSDAFDPDSFLGLEGVEDGRLVRNEHTGQVRAVNSESVSKVIDSEFCGALPVDDPQYDRHRPAQNLTRSLSE